MESLSQELTEAALMKGLYLSFDVEPLTKNKQRMRHKHQPQELLLGRSI
jgi:hypothetical protein